MGIEDMAAKAFRMSDDVWERHANPLSVWSRFPCLPLLALAIWSRVWIGWMSVLPVVLIGVWIWLNPRVFGKPATTRHWASKAVLGERAFLDRGRTEIPAHHQSAIRWINGITFAGFALAVYGLIWLNLAATVFGTCITIIGKMWFLDRMVWLYQELSVTHEHYREWLY